MEKPQLLNYDFGRRLCRCTKISREGGGYNTKELLRPGDLYEYCNVAHKSSNYDLKG